MAFDLEGLFTMLGGRALEAVGERKANNRRKQLNQEMTSYNLGKSRESTAALESYLKSLEPGARAVENTALKTDLGNSLKDSIGVTQAYETPTNFAGKVSPRYGTARARDEAAVSDRLARTVDQLSTLGVPAQRNFNDSVRLNTAAVDTNQANRAIGNMSGAYKQAMNLTTPPPIYHFAGEVLRGLGMSGLTKKKPAPKPAPKTGPMIDDFTDAA